MMSKPWLLIPSQLGHILSPFFLKAYGRIKRYQTLTWKPFTWKNLEFTNPLGLAGGFDKNAEMIESFWTLGASFVEIGTVTPLPQKQNSGPVIGRSLPHQALWNQLGFPSKGVEYVTKKLARFRQPHFTPIFINIGKNRHTDLTLASQDYISLIQKLSKYADAFVINISSPNTPQLRDLLEPKSLKQFLDPIIGVNKNLLHKPLLLKISPDVDDATLLSILDVSADCGIDGWILTNTTVQRTEGMKFPATGGVSGKPLREKSKHFLKLTVAHLQKTQKNRGDFLIISVGGIMTPQDVQERLELGADLVQVYSSLVFDGPFFFQKVYKTIRHL